MTWTKRWYRRLRTLLGRDAVERELDEEVAFHIEMEAEKLRREGLSPEEARRRAGVAFGGVQHAKEAVRDARWLPWAPGLSLDLRLGARMLAKSPGLTLVGGFGLAVAIGVSAGAFALVNSIFFPEVPLAEGDRIVSIVNRDPLRTVYDKRVLHDFGIWQRELRSVVDLGAFRTVQRNLVARSGVEAIPVAEMSASGFRVARIAPLLGRTLVEEDERIGAPPVAVIGERVWETRFGRNADVIGTAIRIGEVPHTIVGVMPEEFAFPVNHSWWVPLRVDPGAWPRSTGPTLDVFARLAPGATHEEAQAELSVLGRRLAAAESGPLEGALESRVMPYTDVFTNSADDDPQLKGMMRLVVGLLLVLVAMNVAVLVYARTVNRTAEIALRTALGATRRRIVTQLFAEALVLSLLAGVAGLGLVAVGLRWLDNWMKSNGDPPFWIEVGLTPGIVIHALVLSILGAAIVGLFPAFRATRDVRVTIGSAASTSEARLGGTWTALIVVQVAAALAILPPTLGALFKTIQSASRSMQGLGVPAGELLSAVFTLEADDDPALVSEDPEKAAMARAERTRVIVTRLRDRLAEEPAVAGTAVSNAMPWSGGKDRFEIEGEARDAKAAMVFYVAPGWFEVLDVDVLAGRGFMAADPPAPSDLARSVIVNRSFVRDVMGGGSAVGRRVRVASSGAEPQPWREIVGVVEDFPAGVSVPGTPTARMYFPVAVGASYMDTLTIRVRGTTAEEFAPKLRAIAASVDPRLQLDEVAPLDVIFHNETKAMGQIALGLAVFAASVLLLSAAGIHALVSFTVNKRRREIGIRAALGADARRILTGVLAHAARQIAIGVAIGLSLAVLLDRASGGELMGGTALIAIPVAAAVAIVGGLLAAVGPARRALRVNPTEAIRAE